MLKKLFYQHNSNIIIIFANLITEIHKEYSVTDKFFALWIKRIYNEKVLTLC